MKTTFTAWIYPKTFIDATRDPDPYIDAAMKEAREAQRQ